MTEEPKKEEVEVVEDPKDKKIQELEEKIQKLTTMNRVLTGYLSNMGIDFLNMSRNAVNEMSGSK